MLHLHNATVDTTSLCNWLRRPVALIFTRCKQSVQHCSYRRVRSRRRSCCLVWIFI